MKTITKYQATDGSEYTDPNKAAERDMLCAKVNAAMLPLGDVPEGVKDGKGWLQHNLETVNQSKDAILEICREEGYAEHFPVFKHQGRECHPLCVIGRILNDNGEGGDHAKTSGGKGFGGGGELSDGFHF